MNSAYRPIVGIETHVELKTQSKMFCGCKNDPFNASKPNIYTCPVCLGLPGALPRANKTAIEWTIRIGLALGCTIHLFSKFDRKHYFYPDLSKGYQISQYDQPLCTDGVVHTEFGDVRIARVHLEEDTGKLLHHTIASDGGTQEKVSLIDFNRSGVPLVEIVTQADIHSSQQAKAYVKTIHQIIRYLNVSNADMEKGSMRLEANISIQNTDEKDRGVLPDYKVEVKNLNSFRYVEKAIDFEVARHADIRDSSNLPIQETRGWNENKNETFAQRTKEDAKDYRYFPDPDLPPLHLQKEYVDDIRSNLPLLPEKVLERYIQEYQIKPTDAAILIEEPGMLGVMAELSMRLKSSTPLQTISLAKIATLLVNKKIEWTYDKSGTINSNVERLMTAALTGTSVDEISSEELMKVVSTILPQYQKAVNDYSSGKKQVIGFLMGMVQKTIGKKVDSKKVQTAIEAYIQGE